MTKAQATPGGSPVEARRATRDLVEFETRANTQSGSHVAKIVNISPLGLMARCAGAIEKGETVMFDLPHVGATKAEVRWVEDGRIGTEFARGIDAADYAIMKSFMPERQTAW